MGRRPVRVGAVVIAGLLVLAPDWAASQCAFNAPGRRTGVLKSFLIRHYAACPGLTFLAPNASTATGTPACSPPLATSTFLFARRGACKLKVKSRVEAPCSDGSGFDCGNPLIKLKCKGIVEADGETPIASEGSGTGWGLQAVARVTLDDRDAGDTTVVDFPAYFAIPATKKKGALKLKTSAQSFLEGFFPDGVALLSPCSSLELKGLSLVDPAGEAFAVLGSSTR